MPHVPSDAPPARATPEDAALRDRARACLLGLAMGDAWGRPLEFLVLPQVRDTPVSVRPGTFHWTDDTHMSMYLARAILDLPAGEELDEDAFGRAVGRRFVEWTEDPLTPSTAPGNTCLRGARAFARHGDWQRSGDRGSDGCGAVMRVAPVALAFSGAELVRAARISSVVTHAHPNAVEATIAGAWLCREALLRGRFDDGVVGAAIGHLRRDWDWGGGVAESLEAALVLADERGNDWLDEEAIPPGDGGWRSGSALGLSVTAALRWGPDGLATAIERAARIEGDSDSVAALTGMFLGAAGGSEVLPVAWLDALPERETLEGLAAELWTRGAPDHPAGGGRQGTGGEHPAASPQAAEPGQQGHSSPAQAPAAQAPTDAAAAGEDPGRPESTAPDSEAETAPAAAPLPSPAARPDAGRPVQLRLTGEVAAADLAAADLAAADLAAADLAAAETASDRPADPLGGPRSSLDHPLRVRWLDLTSVGPRAPRGRIGTCAAPGRQDGTAWERSLGVDLDRLVALYDVDHLVLLLDGAERAALGIAELAAEAEARRIVVLPLPLSPGAAPPAAAGAATVDRILAVARAGRRVVLVGRDGEERPGTLAAAVLARLGLASDAAVRSARAAIGPRAAGSEAQRSFVAAVAADAAADLAGRGRSG